MTLWTFMRDRALALVLYFLAIIFVGTGGYAGMFSPVFTILFLGAAIACAIAGTYFLQTKNH